jgi:putative membrane protein
MPKTADDLSLLPLKGRTMKERVLLNRSFNWRMLLMRFVVNLIALTITLMVVPKVNLDNRTLGSWLWLALMLGVLNTLVKPILQVLTLRFIFATTGLVVILINAFILLLLGWLFPHLLDVNFFWALVGGAVLGLSATFLESLFGLTPPIVSEKYPEIRQRVKDRQFYRTQAELVRIEARQSGKPVELATAKAVAVAAASAVAQRAPALAPVVADDELATADLIIDADANKAATAKPEPALAQPETEADGQTGPTAGAAGEEA